MQRILRHSAIGVRTGIYMEVIESVQRGALDPLFDSDDSAM
ncbi:MULTISPECIES: hypothetical protein [Nocardia]|nr:MULTISPECIES: hypothetical protein [Nocardia]